MIATKDIKKKLWYTFLTGGIGIIITDDGEEHTVYSSSMNFIVYNEDDKITANKCNGKKFSYKLKHIIDANPVL